MNKDPKLVIILLGPPGVGKGTQAMKISKELKLPHISTGDILRANIKENTELGKKAKSIIEAGNLVSDDLINDMVFDRVKKQDCEKGYILDGYPRTTAQANTFLEEAKVNTKILVINFFAENETVVSRICGRLVCKGCSAVFHQEFNPPKADGVCDHCGGTLYQRPDDQKETVMNRLEVYKKNTQPLIELFTQKNLLKTINCEQSPQEVFNETLALIR